MSLARNIHSDKNSDLKRKKLSMKEMFGDPRFVIDKISEFIKEGDFSSSTDLISAYIENSSKYKNQDQFAEAIGTTRQTLYRMFAHQSVSLNLFFNALEKIYDDISEIEK